MTVCVLYGWLTYYGFINERFEIPPPLVVKTCIECEKQKRGNIERLKKTENFKSAQLSCIEIEVVK